MKTSKSNYFHWLAAMFWMIIFLSLMALLTRNMVKQVSSPQDLPEYSAIYYTNCVYVTNIAYNTNMITLIRNVTNYKYVCTPYMEYTYTNWAVTNFVTNIVFGTNWIYRYMYDPSGAGNRLDTVPSYPVSSGVLPSTINQSPISVYGEN